MPVLKNPKHEAFAQARFKGLSASEAYKVAGYKPDRSAAQKLSTIHYIVDRVAELQARLAKKAEVTVESVAKEYDDVIKLARKLKQPGVMRGAIDSKAKLYGLFVERSVVSVTHNYAQMTEEELRFEMAAIAAEARALKPGVQH